MTSKSCHDAIGFHCRIIDAVVDSWDSKLLPAATVTNDASVLWPVNFVDCKTDFERVSCCLNLLNSSSCSLVSASTASYKSDTRARKLRNAGNDVWKSNRLAAALQLYTRAIFLAQSNEEYALAYANRSCVLARLCADREVLEDIDRALKHDYPTDRSIRLLVRRGQALLNLDREKQAECTFRQAHALLTSSKPGSVPNAIEQLIKDGLTKSTEANSIAVSNAKRILPMWIADSKELPVEDDGDKNVEKLSSLTLSDSESPAYDISFGGEAVGWQVTARKTLKSGQLILRDVPYVRRLEPDRFFTFCHQCFRRCLNLLPCRRCAEVGFCSEACETNAWIPDWSSNSDPLETVERTGVPCHRFECGQINRIALTDYAGWKWLRTTSDTPRNLSRYRQRLMNYKTNIGIGGPLVTWLAFAAVARTPPHILKERIQNSLQSGETTKFDSQCDLLAFSGKRNFPTCDLRADDFSTVGWLVTNAEKRTLHDMWQRTVAAVFLTHCLSAGGYPVDWDNESASLQLTGDGDVPRGQPRLPASWVAACFLHMIQVISSNAHTYTTHVLQAPPIQPSIKPLNSSGWSIKLDAIRSEEIGSGLYPILSLLNHSCDPNSTQVFLADGSCAIYALRTIHSNEAIYSNYGYHYAIDGRKQRKSALADQYHFSCQCDPCRQNWKPVGITDCVRCIACDGAFKNDDKNVMTKSHPTQKICTCSAAARLPTLKVYKKWRCDMEQHAMPIPQAYYKLPFYHVPQQLLRDHIHVLNELLDRGIDEACLIRPSWSIDYMQEMLKVLLDLHHGYWYTETESLTLE